MRGTLKNLPRNKGFGFIQNQQKTEYFFHKTDFTGFWNDLEDDFYNGNEIELEFEPYSTNKGPRACNVRRIDSGVIREVS
jgi:cold shock CspA family protein